MRGTDTHPFAARSSPHREDGQQQRHSMVTGAWSVRTLPPARALLASRALKAELFVVTGTFSRSPGAPRPSRG
eukprot:691527-Rhodomonas_salina.2